MTLVRPPSPQSLLLLSRGIFPAANRARLFSERGAGRRRRLRVIAADGAADCGARWGARPSARRRYGERVNGAKNGANGGENPISSLFFSLFLTFSIKVLQTPNMSRNWLLVGGCKAFRAKCTDFFLMFL